MIRAVLFLATAALFAELSPQEYRLLQLAAPEQLEIEVDKVRASAGGGLVGIDATVVRVNKSASGLKPGKSIRIYYHYDPNPKPAPGLDPMPLLELRKRYPAYLAKNAKGNFEPVARSRSFAPVPASAGK
jgi:hypothetical protein